MGFILNCRHKGKDIAVAVNRNFTAFVVHNGAGAVAVILHHAKGRHMFQRGAAQRLLDRADLAAAAIDQQQVRQCGKLVGRAIRLVSAAGRLYPAARRASVSASEA